jgi:hypothetical protein
MPADWDMLGNENKSRKKILLLKNLMSTKPNTNTKIMEKK